VNAQERAPEQPVPAKQGESSLPAGPTDRQSPFSEKSILTREVTIPAKTPLRVRLDESVGTLRNRAGDVFRASLVEPLRIDERTVLPKGTPFSGRVNLARPSGRLQGTALIAITLDSLRLDGKRYEIETNSMQARSAGHKKHNLSFIGVASGLGAVIGAIAGHGKGAAIGAGSGAAIGTAAAAATGKQQAGYPAETVLRFSLSAPAKLQLSEGGGPAARQGPPHKTLSAANALQRREER
jgi:hypothetical protein